jgi:hypothetical protein
VIPKLVESLSIAIQRAMTLLFGLVITLLLLVAVSANQRAQEAKSLASLEKSLSALHTYATTVAAYICRVLMDDYPNEGDDPEAVLHLLRDTLHARRLLSQISDHIGDNINITTERRVTINPMLNDISKLFHFNQADDQGALASEPALILAETSVGTYRWGYSLESRSIDELSRLGYLASIRPASLRAGLSRIEMQTIASASSDTATNDLMAKIEEANRQIFSSESKQARKNAQILWNNWLRFKPDDRINETLVARASQQTLAEEYLRVVREAEQLKAVQEGRTDTELPGLPQPVELRLLLFFLPYAVGGIYLYVTWLLTRMRSSVGAAAEADLQDWSATTTPLIGLHSVNRASLIAASVCRAGPASLPLVATVALVLTNRSSIDLGWWLPDRVLSMVGVVLRWRDSHVRSLLLFEQLQHSLRCMQLQGRSDVS